MFWLDSVAVYILEVMIRMAWHRFLGRICKILTCLVRQKLGENVPPSINDIEVTVQTQLRRLFPDLANEGLTHEFRFTHRLDFPTSGLLCIALHKRAAGEITKCFVKKLVDKYYLALVRGHVSKEMMDVELPIGDDMRDEWHGIRMATPVSPHAGCCKTAHTRLLVLQKGLYNNYPATKVLLKPITGRRHQLRVHMSESGHTIVGDFTYSNRCDIFPYRMFLHAYRLIIPSKLEYLDVRTDDPFSENDPRNKWVPLDTLNVIADESFEKLKFGRCKNNS